VFEITSAFQQLSKLVAYLKHERLVEVGVAGLLFLLRLQVAPLIGY